MAKAISRTVLILVFSVMISISFTDAWAQAEIGFDIRGGLAVPIANFNDAFNLGFGVQSSIYIEFSPVAAAGLGLGYNRFAYDESQAGQGVEASGGEVSLLDICPEFRFMVGTEDMPTFAWVIGAGLYRIMQSDLELVDAVIPANSGTLTFDSINKFGINTAGKVVFPISPNVKIGVEAMYHHVFTSDDRDFDMNYFDFMAVIVITTGT